MAKKRKTGHVAPGGLVSRCGERSKLVEACDCDLQSYYLRAQRAFHISSHFYDIYSFTPRICFIKVRRRGLWTLLIRYMTFIFAHIASFSSGERAKRGWQSVRHLPKSLIADDTIASLLRLMAWVLPSCSPRSPPPPRLSLLRLIFWLDNHVTEPNFSGG